MSKEEINMIIENFIIYACGSDTNTKCMLENTLDDYQDVMSNEGSGLMDCPFLNQNEERV